MSIKLADLQHPDALHDDDSRENSLENSLENSVEQSESGGVTLETNADRAVELVGMHAFGLAFFLVVSSCFVALFCNGLGTVKGARDIVLLCAMIAMVILTMGCFSWTMWRGMRKSVRDAVIAAEEWRTPQEELERAVRANDPAHVRHVLDAERANAGLWYGSPQSSLLFTAVRAAMTVEHRTPEDTQRAVNTVKVLMTRVRVNGFGCFNEGSVLDFAEEAKRKGQFVPDDLLDALREEAVKEQDFDIEAQAQSLDGEIAHAWHPLFVRAAAQRTPAQWIETLSWESAGYSDFGTFDDILAQRDSTGRTVMNWAVWVGNLDLVRWLAYKGVPRFNEKGDDVFAEVPFPFASDDLEHMKALRDAHAEGMRDVLREALADEPEPDVSRPRKRL